MSEFRQFYDNLPIKQQTDMSLAEDAWQAGWSAAWNTAWDGAVNAVRAVVHNASHNVRSPECELVIRAMLHEFDKLLER